MSEIKPCPFCGSSNIHGPIRNDYVGDHYCQTWFVSCNNCSGGMDGEDSGDSAIEAWNNRPLEDELVDLLEQALGHVVPGYDDGCGCRELADKIRKVLAKVEGD